MRPTRERFVLLLRWRHWSSLVLAGGVLTALAELFRETVGRTTPMGFAAFGILAVGTALKVRDLSKDFRVWRLLRPEYRGLDDFARRINASPVFAASFITRGPGEASVDATALVGEMTDLLERVDFVGDDAALNTIAAQINAAAFSGSVYHASSRTKLARNRPLAARQPASFALVRAAAQSFTHVGLATVLPMNVSGLTAYLSGKLSDNDIAHRHIARFGETPAALLVFMIASADIARDSEPRGVFELLVQLCLLQIVLLTAQNSCTGEVEVYVANAEPKWQTAFQRMNFVGCPEFGSADQQTVFQCRVTVEHAQAALDQSMRAVPRLARQLEPGGERVASVAPDD